MATAASHAYAMLTPFVPLDGHECFRARTLEDVSQKVSSVLGATCIRAERQRDQEAQVNRFSLPGSQLWYCSYGAPISLNFTETEFLRVQFHHAGVGTTHLGRQRIAITMTQACLSSGIATVDFGQDYRQVVWRVMPEQLVRKLAAMTGKPLTRKLEFANCLDLRSPASLPILQILRCLLSTICHAHLYPSILVLTELEQALIVALLIGSHHNLSGELCRTELCASGLHIRRIEEYIESHAQGPIRIEDLAAISGTSVRSLYRAFRETRGYSPMEFARQRRLARAQALLRDPHSELGVTEVARSSGFTNLSHFSREFSKAFGESPSALLKRKAR